MSKTVSLLASTAFAVLLVALAAQSEASAAKEAQYGPRLAVSSYYSHTTADDPMFHFGEPGVGHLHDFFCNTSTKASSTYDALVLAPDDTCKQEGDKSAYWAPVHADLNNGVYERLDPVGKMIGYYESRRAPATEHKNLRARLPAREPRRDGGAGRVLYKCPGRAFRSSPPGRCDKEALDVRYIAPSCWDGKTDAPAAYNVVKARATACPRPTP
jgi:hypothetical protein